MKDLSFQFDSDPCPQNDPNQGDLMAAIAAAADPPVAFRNFDHLVLVEPNTDSAACVVQVILVYVVEDTKKAESGIRLSQWLYQGLMQTTFRLVLLLLLMN
jgi:hypothetical protein